MQTITVELKSGKKITDHVTEIWFLQIIEGKGVNRYTAEEFFHGYLSYDPSSSYEIQTTIDFTWEIPIIVKHSEIMSVSIGNDPVTHIREFF